MAISVGHRENALALQQRDHLVTLPFTVQHLQCTYLESTG